MEVYIYRWYRSVKANVRKILKKILRPKNQSLYFLLVDVRWAICGAILEKSLKVKGFKVWSESSLARRSSSSSTPNILCTDCRCHIYHRFDKSHRYHIFYRSSIHITGPSDLPDLTNNLKSILNRTGSQQSNTGIPLPPRSSLIRTETEHL